MWTTAKETLEDLIKYLTSTQTLYQRKGQLKSKRLQQMTQVLLQSYTIYLWCVDHYYNYDLYINDCTSLNQIIESNKHKENSVLIILL